MNCDTQTLISQALCINQCVPAGMQLAVLVNLACQILTGGGGGGGSALTGVFGGTGSPVGNVTPTGSYAIYIQTDSVPAGQIWEWYGNSWH